MRLPALDPGAFGAAKIAGKQAALRFDGEVAVMDGLDGLVEVRTFKVDPVVRMTGEALVFLLEPLPMAFERNYQEAA